MMPSPARLHASRNVAVELGRRSARDCASSCLRAAGSAPRATRRTSRGTRARTRCAGDRPCLSASSTERAWNAALGTRSTIDRPIEALRIMSRRSSSTAARALRRRSANLVPRTASLHHAQISERFAAAVVGGQMLAELREHLARQREAFVDVAADEQLVRCAAATLKAGLGARALGGLEERLRGIGSAARVAQRFGAAHQRSRGDRPRCACRAAARRPTARRRARTRAASRRAARPASRARRRAARRPRPRGGGSRRADRARRACSRAARSRGARDSGGAAASGTRAAIASRTRS